MKNSGGCHLLGIQAAQSVGLDAKGSDLGGEGTTEDEMAGWHH